MSDSVQPIRWVSDSALDQTGAALLAELISWGTAWGLPLPVRGDVRVVRLAAAKGAPADDGVLSGGEPAVQALRNKLTHLLHPSAGQASAVLKLVSKRLAADLLARLRARFSVDAASTAQGRHSLGDWGVQATLQWQGCEVSLALSCSQLRAADLLPTTTSPKLGKVFAEKSLSQLPVELLAEVGRASISVPDLLNLAVDDVIVLSGGLDAPIQIGSPGSNLRLLARLGSTSEDARAVSLLATSSS